MSTDYDWNEIFATHGDKDARDIAAVIGLPVSRVYAASYRLNFKLKGPGSGRKLCVERKQRIIELLSAHRDKGHTELARMLGCSKQYVYALRKKYKDDINEKSS